MPDFRGQYDELADRIRSLIDESARAGMGQAARRMSLGHTFRRNVDELVAVYQGTAPAQR